MLMRFENKVAIITGGSQGMGKAVALGIAKEGGNVVITSRSEEKLMKAADEIRTAGGKVMTVAGNIMNADSVKKVLAKTLDTYGKVDILYNYAGGEPNYSKWSLFKDQNEAYWNAMITYNLNGTFLFCHAVIDSMIKQKYGRIINTAAIAGLQGGAMTALYSTVKGGIIRFTQSLAAELAEYQITVNCVSPGGTRTPGFETLFGREAMQKAGESSPMKRLGEPEDVANAVLYFASDEASYVTGQNLTIDGGSTLVRR
jgi:NAD(P)-dependent dehydrogenase (short-subunit alcohol dehydrogenase family)